MADDIAPDETADVADVVETSDDSDVELEDIEITEDELEDNADEDSQESEESDPDSQEPDSTDESEDSTESEDTDEESNDDDSEAEQKRRNAEYAQKRIAEREAKQKELQQSQQEYLQDAEDDRDLALRQLQIDAYNNKVEFNTNKLQNGLERAVASIDLLTDPSAPPEAKEFLYDAIDEFEAIYVTRDKYGNVTEVKGDVYAYLTNKADSVRRLTGVGARNQIKAKEQAKTRTTQPPSKAPKEQKVDSDLKDFEEAWD